MGDIRFVADWDDVANNKNIYPAAEDRPARRASQREIFVILHKVPNARLWCHRSERGKVSDFVACINDAEARLAVDKGIHPDKYVDIFRLHLSVAVEWGPHAGLKCHLYGRTMANNAWEVDLITLYDPRIKYRSADLEVLQQGVAPAPWIVVAGSGVPPATYGSLAYAEGGWVTL